jgi:hypothetical protein
MLVLLKDVIKLDKTSRMPSSGILRCVDVVRTDVSEERSASLIRVARIDELGITLAVCKI